MPQPQPPGPSAAAAPVTSIPWPALTSAGEVPATASAAPAAGATSETQSDSLLLKQLLFGQAKVLQEVRDLKAKLVNLEAQVHMLNQGLDARIDVESED